MVVVLAVVGGVLLIHLLMEFFTKKYKAWKRQKSQQNSQQNSVRYKNVNHSKASIQGEASEDDTDAGETSRLIFLADGPTGVQKQRKALEEDRGSVIMPEPTGLVSPEGERTMTRDGEVGVTGSAVLEVQPSRSDAEWLLTHEQSSFEQVNTGDVVVRGVASGCREVRIEMGGGRESSGSVLSDSGAWSPIYRDLDDEEEGGAGEGRGTPLDRAGMRSVGGGDGEGVSVECDLIDIDLHATMSETSSAS